MMTTLILLGRSRVGSNLVLRTLEGHPEVTVHGEVLAPNKRPEGDLSGHVRRLLEAKSKASVLAFKVFYYHVDTSNDLPVWESLISRSDVRVVHLKRRNILRTHVSRARAAATNQWAAQAGAAPVAAPRLWLDYEDCLADFKRTRNYERRFDEMLACHGTPTLQLEYESVVADFSPTMKRLQRFAGVADLNLPPALEKQAQLPLTDEIANYEDLKTAFVGTEWESFFE